MTVKELYVELRGLEVDAFKSTLNRVWREALTPGEPLHRTAQRFGRSEENRGTCTWPSSSR